jgi:HK97 gp10 family phage protein
MANRSTVEVKGLRELDAAMKALPRKLHRRILSAALAAGGREIEREAKQRVPILRERTLRRLPGVIRRNIRVRPVRPHDGHNATVIVSVRNLNAKQVTLFKRTTGLKGAFNPNDPFYWRFVEFGTSKMAARPFLRPAFEVKKYQAAKEIKDRLAKRIEIEATKLRKRVI